MVTVFISYVRGNEATVKSISEDIEALGYIVWFDQELIGGQSWWNQILAKIRESNIFVFLLDIETLNSKACMREYGYATDLSKPVLPILISSEVSTEILPPTLSQIQYVHYKKNHHKAALRLARALQNIPPSKPLPEPLPKPPDAPVSHLGRLLGLVESELPLNYEKQSALLLDLKRGMRDQKSHRDIEFLLQKFRKRQDLLASIAEEIDDWIQENKEVSSHSLQKWARDATSVPSLDSQELIAEMGELYWMAICRDIPFNDWVSNPTIQTARESLNKLWWFRRDRTDALNGKSDAWPESLARRHILSDSGIKPVPLEMLFRGVTPGEQTGPYLSQFLLLGNTRLGNEHGIMDGYIQESAIRNDQEILKATFGQDYIQTWRKWLESHNGACLHGTKTNTSGHPFIATPRDLATYVYRDALYDVYLNTCLILLGLGAPFDPGLPFQSQDYIDMLMRSSSLEGPNILTLVTDVACRALKAEQYRKSIVHKRLLPEKVGEMMCQRRKDNNTAKNSLRQLANMEATFAGISGIGYQLDTMNGTAQNWQLPMTFPEESTMHPSCGAGHTTVAVACITIIKAWFDHDRSLKDGGNPLAYEPYADGGGLNDVSATLGCLLTVEGELNKLAANIAIGKNWAGLHYYSDYIESFQIGEKIALEYLREMKLTYGENFSLTVPLRDGKNAWI